MLTNNEIKLQLNSLAIEKSEGGKITGGFSKVADEIGVDYSTVKHFVQGDIKTPTTATLQKFSDFLIHGPAPVAPKLSKEKQVAAPEHYRQGQIECIDAIRESMSAGDFAGYCKGNVIKYTWRAHNHNEVPLVHLNKAADYLRWWIETEAQIAEVGNGSH
jgi:hypothetical protein